jgi:hypothetical protein
MSRDPDPAELLGRTASHELLAGQDRTLPDSVGQPPPPAPPSQARRKVVAIGATLTGLTLVGGIALIVLGLLDAISSGFGALALTAIVLGTVLVSTHWGWVHVAEFTSNTIDARHSSEIEDIRGRWLAAIEPYTRYEVTTHVEDDGSLTIATIRYQPVSAGEGQFTFVREILDPERHSEEEPAAPVAERAEHLRRRAAQLTEQERARYLAAADAQHQHQLGRQDEEELLRARRAASEALSHQINTNLRDPPLTE